MTISRRISPPLLLLLAAVLPMSTVQAVSLETQRDRFLAAERALKKDDSQRYHRLKRELRDYPLLPYLEYAELRGKLAAARPDAVRRFLADYAASPLAGRLRNTWLDLLAKRGRWGDYVEFYRPADSTQRRCHYLHSLIATGQRDNAFSRVEPLWLVGRSQPKACDPVFDAWRKAGRLTPELVWQRIALAMEKGQTRLAGYLQRLLKPSERPWVERWLRVRSKPELIRDRREFSAGHPQRQPILLYGLGRMARQDVEQAAVRHQCAGLFLDDPGLRPPLGAGRPGGERGQLLGRRPRPGRPGVPPSPL